MTVDMITDARPHPQPFRSSPGRTLQVCPQNSNSKHVTQSNLNTSRTKGSQVRSPRPRRQRTTSINQSTTVTSNESIIRSNNRTIYTAGRPPWYDCAGQQVEPFVIGKQFGRGQIHPQIDLICAHYQRHQRWQCVRQDDGRPEDYRRPGRSMGDAIVNGLFLQGTIHPKGIYFKYVFEINYFPLFLFKILNEKQHHQAERNEYNFDHPDAFDIDLMIEVLRKLKEGRKVEVPIYNFVTHARETNTKTMYGANVIIFEGILVFHSPEILDMLDMKVFVDTDADIRLARRLKR